MPSGQALSYDEREEIEKYIKRGESLTEIARILARSKNAIVTEVRINGGRDEYSAVSAQARKFDAVNERYAKVSEKLKGRKDSFGMHARIIALESGIITLSLEIEKLKKAQYKTALHG